MYSFVKAVVCDEDQCACEWSSTECTCPTVVCRCVGCGFDFPRNQGVVCLAPQITS